MRNNGLRTKWTVSYQAGLDADHINRQLGFSRPTAVKWAGDREGITNIIPELDEMTVGFWMIT